MFFYLLSPLIIIGFIMAVTFGLQNRNAIDIPDVDFSIDINLSASQSEHTPLPE